MKKYTYNKEAAKKYIEDFNSANAIEVIGKVGKIKHFDEYSYATLLTHNEQNNGVFYSFLVTGINNELKSKGLPEIQSGDIIRLVGVEHKQNNRNSNIKNISDYEIIEKVEFETFDI